MAITMDGIFVNGQKATFRPEDILSGDASVYTEEIGTAVEEWLEENVTGGEQVTDTTLTLPGVPADAEAAGNKIEELKEDLKQTEDGIIETAGVIEELECGLTEEVKTALLACFEQVAWIGADGQTYYDALEIALNKKRSLSSISVVFTQGSAVIYDTDELYAIKQYLTVTATYDDGSTKEVNNYTLSGKLVAGTSTITVAYNKKTATFNVTVTHQEKTLESISATFSSSAVITTDNVLDDLRPYLTVRATYSDDSTNTVTNYTLSGSLNVGTNTITVTYSGKTATFTVNVTQAEKTLQSITAVFNQGSAVIYTDSSLNDLKPYLTVTARYSDDTTQTVTGYALSGTLTEGTSTITASYSGKTTTFIVENVIDFYNIWEWGSTNTDHSKLTRTPTAAFEKVIDGEKLGIRYADNMLPDNLLRGFAVSKGKCKMRNAQDGSEVNYYPIPIPSTAEKLTATITPSSQLLAVYVFKYNGNSRADGYNYELVAPATIGYVAGEYILEFTPNSDLFLTFNCKPASNNYSSNPEPEMHIIFE